MSLRKIIALNKKETDLSEIDRSNNTAPAIDKSDKSASFFIELTF
jgi:hypothetical protein